MVRAVIFDMYETLITHYRSPLYFSLQMAADAGIPEERFRALWQATDFDRTIGRMTFEEALKSILTANRRYTDALFNHMVKKRIAVKEDCFEHLHPGILPVLEALKRRGLLIGLISNCFSEEAEVIRKSVLFPYFDAALLSWEQGVQKPDAEIFARCMQSLSTAPQECVYIGDGGSCELEAAQSLGMRAFQAVWYFQEGITLPLRRNDAFVQIEQPMDLPTLIDSLNTEF